MNEPPTWLCAGQSNMGMRVAQCAEADAAAAITCAAQVSVYREGRWEPVSAANVQSTAAVPFFFAAALGSRLEAPVRIAIAARGGTGIEAWLPVSAFPRTDRADRLAALATEPAVLRAAAEDEADFKPYGSHRLARWGLGRAAPAQLYESLVVPLAHLRIDGLLWYQGESNADSVEEAVEYRAWLVALIHAYRELWRRPDLPVVVVQLPEYWDPATEEGRAWEALRKSQAEAVSGTTRTALVDTAGLGDPRDIHPKRKRDVGQRAATAAAELLSTPHRCAPELNETESR